MNQKQKSNSQNKIKPKVISSESSSSEDSDVAGLPYKTPFITRTTGYGGAKTHPCQASSEEKVRKNPGASGEKAAGFVDIFAQFRGMKINEKAKGEIQMAHSKNAAKANKTLARIRKNLKRQQDEQLPSVTHLKEVAKETVDKKDVKCALFQEESDQHGMQYPSSAGLDNYPEKSSSGKKKTKKRRHQSKKASSQFENTQCVNKTTQVKNTDFQFKNTDPQLENTEHKVEDSDSNFNMIIYHFENLKSYEQVENSEVKVENFYEKFKKGFNKDFEDSLQRQINQEASEDLYDVFFNGFPILEDVMFYNRMWDRLTIPFSFHQSIWDDINSISENQSDLSKTSKHSETFKVENDDISYSSSPDPQLKRSESSNFEKPNFSEDSLLNFESLSENSVPTAVGVNVHVSDFEAEDEFKQNIFQSSETTFQAVQDQIFCISKNQTLAKSPSSSEATAEFPKLDLSPESANFSINTEASGETLPHPNTSDSSHFSFVPASHTDEDVLNSNLKCVDELENDNRSSKRTSSGEISDNEIKPDFERIDDNTHLDHSAKVKEFCRWLYDVNILIQKAFYDMFYKATKILESIYISRPEAYKDKLLEYASTITVLNGFNEELDLEHQRFFEVVEAPESIFNCEEVATQLFILSQKVFFLFRYYCTLKKYKEMLTDLFATTSRTFRQKE